jgi:ribosomal protein L32
MITLIHRPQKNNFWYKEQKRVVSMQFLVNNYNIDKPIIILDTLYNDISDSFFKETKKYGANKCEFCGKLFTQHRTSLDPDNTVCGACNEHVLKEQCELEYKSHRKCLKCGKRMTYARYFNCQRCVTIQEMIYIGDNGAVPVMPSNNETYPSKIPLQPEGLKKSLKMLTEQTKHEKLLLSKLTKKEKQKWHW